MNSGEGTNPDIPSEFIEKTEDIGKGYSQAIDPESLEYDLSYIDDELSDRDSEKQEAEIEDEIKASLKESFDKKTIKLYHKELTLAENILQIAKDKERAMPVSQKKKQLSDVIIKLYPDEADRKILLTVLQEERKQILAKFDSSEMERIERTGQQERYSEYRELEKRNQELWATINFFEDLESGIAKEREFIENQSNIIFERYRKNEYRFIIDSKLYSMPLERLLAIVEDIIDYKKTELGDKLERSEEEKTWLKDEIGYQISRIISHHERELLINKLNQIPGHENQAQLLKELR